MTILTLNTQVLLRKRAFACLLTYLLASTLRKMPSGQWIFFVSELIKTAKYEDCFEQGRNHGSRIGGDPATTVRVTFDSNLAVLQTA